MPNPTAGGPPDREEQGLTVPLHDVKRDEMIGRVVGSWRVVKLLGEGGMGSVYMGEHPAIGSKVAIKMLHPRFDADERIVERFFNEAKAVNVIGHDNIVSILDFNVADGGRHYFVMEFLHGQPLQALVQPGLPLSLGRAGPILLQCCRALQAAHERGIVHRDFKPDNVFLVDRYQSMSELYEALHGCMEQLGISAELPLLSEGQPSSPRPAPAARRTDPAVTPPRGATQPRTRTVPASAPARGATQPRTGTRLIPAPQPRRANTALLAAVGAAAAIATGAFLFVWFRESSAPESKRPRPVPVEPAPVQGGAGA